MINYLVAFLIVLHKILTRPFVTPWSADVLHSVPPTERPPQVDPGIRCLGPAGPLFAKLWERCDYQPGVTETSIKEIVSWDSNYKLRHVYKLLDRLKESGVITVEGRARLRITVYHPRVFKDRPLLTHDKTETANGKTEIANGKMESLLLQSELAEVPEKQGSNAILENPPRTRASKYSK